MAFQESWRRSDAAIGAARLMYLELLRFRHQVAELADRVTRLMQSPHAQGDATWLPKYFLAGLESNAEPRVVACYEQGDLVGVLYASELLFCGMRTGFAFGGDPMGRGLVAAPADREAEVFVTASQYLLRNGIHAMRLQWTPRQALAEGALQYQGRQARMQGRLDVHPEGDWLRLKPDYEAFLSELGPHTRRNLRYYRRKAEAQGYRYTGVLTDEALLPALQSLNLVADYPLDQARLDRDRRYFAAFGGPVIVGLRGDDGQFISLMTGFRHGAHLHVLSQINGQAEAVRKLSVSVVLRGYLIEDFIRRGCSAVHFMHGSSPMLGRFCDPVDLHIVSIDGQSTLMTPFKMACSRLAEAFVRRGLRVPYRLQRAAGTYLE